VRQALESTFRALARRRLAVQFVLDALAWAIALTLSALARYDLAVIDISWPGLLAAIPMAGLVQLLVGLTAGLYRGRWRFGSFEEVAALAWATGLTALILGGLDVAVRPAHPVPVSAMLVGGFVALVFMSATRYVWRLALERRRRPLSAAGRTLVFGAGEGGAQVVTAMLRDPASPLLPVGLLDDDPRKRNLRLSGVPVLGGRGQLGAAAAARDADTLLIAVPTAGHELITELSDLAFAAGLQVKVLPPVGELFGSRVGVDDIRSLTEEDLLGRHAVETDIEAIAGYLSGRRVLVTGAGGSIGSELCRQIWRFAPSELVMVDRNENALHAVQLSLEGRALLESRNIVLADIRDRGSVDEVFATHRPEVVFHAAALKHLTLLERHPAEAVKTNVRGTLNVLQSAAANRVERFVNISTDKAADPVSVLGYTKRIAERLTAEVASQTDGTFLSVRFGNVLGSDGSVLFTFRSQIAADGPVTVTDPDVTRYFMTVSEAVQLVIQAAAIGRGGEVLVLDMGEPVRIADLARRMIAQASRPIKIVFTGLRPGEKRHEHLLGRGEPDLRPIHPMISHVTAPPLGVERVEDLVPESHPHDFVSSLRMLASDGLEVG
jgi:FlaA1/EpsC-like NDP-sugar epimerase